MDIGELAFEGIVGAGASMLTAGLGAGTPRGLNPIPHASCGGCEGLLYPILDAKAANREEIRHGIFEEDA
jgi:hypothetical protein